jgi:hypothetical protein
MLLTSTSDGAEPAIDYVMLKRCAGALIGTA